MTSESIFRSHHFKFYFSSFIHLFFHISFKLRSLFSVKEKTKKRVFKVVFYNKFNKIIVIF